MRFRQRPRLVAAQDIHAAEIVNRRQPSTITCLRDRRMAPCANVTDTTIGKSSGVRPTASASANRKESSSGRWKSRFAKRTNSRSSDVSRTIHQPEIADADCEGGRRGLLLQSVCDRSKLGLASRRENHGLGGSADDRATHEDQIAGKGTLVPGCGGQYGVLFGRIGLARQQRLALAR